MRGMPSYIVALFVKLEGEPAAEHRLREMLE